MKTKIDQNTKSKQVSFTRGLAIAALAIGVGLSTVNAASQPTVAVTFESAADAGAALEKAAIDGDRQAAAKILGPQASSMLTTGDKDTDLAEMATFLGKYRQMNRWVEMSDGSRVLYIGADNFEFPVPIAKNSDGKWYFDSVAGAEEIRTRDIGRNELLTIDACGALIDAQEEFASVGDAHEFAQRIISTPGQKNGLYWPAAEGIDESPLADLDRVPKGSRGEGDAQGMLALDGYTFRILTAQGEAAPGGARNYLINGKMVAGFAIVATPVKYGETGVMTFIMGRNGIVYQRDLGPDSAKIAAAIREFNPTGDWTPAE